MESPLKSVVLNAQSRDDLITLLKQSFALFKSSLSLVLSEREAMVSQDMVKLEAVLDEKSVVLGRLGVIDKAALDLVPLGRLSEYCMNEPLVRPMYESLMLLAASVSAENKANASLTRTRMAQISSAMRSMRSAAGVESVSEYRPRGIVRGEGGKTRLGAG